MFHNRVANCICSHADRGEHLRFFGEPENDVLGAYVVVLQGE